MKAVLRTSDGTQDVGTASSKRPLIIFGPRESLSSLNVPRVVCGHGHQSHVRAPPSASRSLRSGPVPTAAVPTSPKQTPGRPNRLAVETPTPNYVNNLITRTPVAGSTESPPHCQPMALAGPRHHRRRQTPQVQVKPK